MSNKSGGSIAALAGLVIGAIALGHREAKAAPAPAPPPAPPKKREIKATVSEGLMTDEQGRPVEVPPNPALVQQVASAIKPTAASANQPLPAIKPPAPPAPVTVKQEAAMQLPLYPQGLEVSKGSVKGKVDAVSKAADGYHYQITAGMSVFSQQYQGTEAQVRDMVAEKCGQQSYGFAFPVGVTVAMKGQSWTITDRKLKDGQRYYVTNRGEIEEPQLILALYQAQRS